MRWHEVLDCCVQVHWQYDEWVKRLAAALEWHRFMKEDNVWEKEQKTKSWERIQEWQVVKDCTSDLKQACPEVLHDTIEAWLDPMCQNGCKLQKVDKQHQKRREIARLGERFFYYNSPWEEVLDLVKATTTTEPCQCRGYKHEWAVHSVSIDWLEVYQAVSAYEKTCYANKTRGIHLGDFTTFINTMKQLDEKYPERVTRREKRTQAVGIARALAEQGKTEQQDQVRAKAEQQVEAKQPQQQQRELKQPEELTKAADALAASAKSNPIVAEAVLKASEPNWLKAIACCTLPQSRCKYQNKCLHARWRIGVIYMLTSENTRFIYIGHTTRVDQKSQEFQHETRKQEHGRMHTDSAAAVTSDPDFKFIIVGKYKMYATRLEWFRFLVDREQEVMNACSGMLLNRNMAKWSSSPLPLTDEQKEYFAEGEVDNKREARLAKRAKWARDDRKKRPDANLKAVHKLRRHGAVKPRSGDSLTRRKKLEAMTKEQLVDMEIERIKRKRTREAKLRATPKGRKKDRARKRKSYHKRKREREEEEEQQQQQQRKKQKVEPDQPME